MSANKMSKNIDFLIILSFIALWFASFIASSTYIMVTTPCTYESNDNSKDPSQFPTLMKCDVWQDDGTTQKRITYKLTAPTVTALKNCFVKKVDLGNPSVEALYAPMVNGKCEPFSSGLYVSMIYVSDIHNKDEIFNRVLALKYELEKKAEYAKAKLKIPFYKFWFCEECKKFLKAIESGQNILIRSINMNYDDADIAQIAIKANDERWLLSLERKNNEFFITSIYRTN